MPSISGVKQILEKFSELPLKPLNILLLPLYPQFSTTTTKSSVQDFIEYTAQKVKRRKELRLSRDRLSGISHT